MVANCFRSLGITILDNRTPGGAGRFHHVPPAARYTISTNPTESYSVGLDSRWHFGYDCCARYVRCCCS